MRNTGVVLASFLAVVLTAAAARAADKDLSACLDVATKLEAGGDVTNSELTAAQQACARAQQTASDTSTRRKVDAAVATVADELRKQQAAHHPH